MRCQLVRVSDRVAAARHRTGGESRRLDALELSRDPDATCSMMNPPGRKGSTAARIKRHPKMPRKRASRKPQSEDVFGQARRQPKMFRAGLYARVSTNDQQTLAMQSRAMREYAARRGWMIDLQV